MAVNYQRETLDIISIQKSFRYHTGIEEGKWIQKPVQRQGDKYVKRAKIVLEQKLGRELRDGYVTHHVNGVKNDDRPENLDEMERSEHAQLNLVRRIKGGGYVKAQTNNGKQLLQ